MDSTPLLLLINGGAASPIEETEIEEDGVGARANSSLAAHLFAASASFLRQARRAWGAAGLGAAGALYSGRLMNNFA
jgi:hypothetical protein